MKIADCHMHSFFSSDSEAPTEEMVKRAVELGLPAICLTDHYDMDYSTGEFQLDTPAYAAKIRELQEKYHDRIDIRFGVELGLQLHLKERMEEYVNAWPFDYVIGSMHVIDGKDPYYEDAFPDWTAEELYRAYFSGYSRKYPVLPQFPDAWSSGLCGTLLQRKGKRLQLPRICGRDRYHFKRADSVRYRAGNQHRRLQGRPWRAESDAGCYQKIPGTGRRKDHLRCRCPQTGTYSVSFRGRGSHRAGSRIPVLRAV